MSNQRPLEPIESADIATTSQSSYGTWKEEKAIPDKSRGRVRAHEATWKRKEQKC